MIDSKTSSYVTKSCLYIQPSPSLADEWEKSLLASFSTVKVKHSGQ